jgi:ribosomal protein S18 acetylase RimI-like enzyme
MYLWWILLNLLSAATCDCFCWVKSPLPTRNSQLSRKMSNADHTAAITQTTDAPSDVSFIVRLASERDNNIVALTDMINSAYKVGEKGIILDSDEHPFQRVTVSDVQALIRDGKLLILTTAVTATPTAAARTTSTDADSTKDPLKVLGCVKVGASQVQDPDDPLLGQICGEWGCLAVALADQRQGHGHQLVQAAEDYAKNELGCNFLQLELLSPTHERHQHKDMLREWYTTRLGYQLKLASDYDKSTIRLRGGTLLQGTFQLATDADSTSYRKQL